MFSNQAAEISLNRPVASVDALRGDKVNSKFLVGTSSARISEDNHLLLLNFHSDANHLSIDGRLSHPKGPVELIKTSPSDPSSVLTTAENDSGDVTLWKIPSEIVDKVSDDVGGGSMDEDDDYYDPSNTDTDEVQSMEELTTLPTSDGNSPKVADIAWRGPSWDEDPSAASMGDVATLNADGTLKQWDINFGSAESTRSCKVQSSSNLNLPPKMAWDPHNSDITAVSTGDIVQLFDWREAPSATRTIHSQNGHPHHRYGITDLDYNPNKPNLLVTSGKDGLLKFWDLRKTGSGHYDADGEETGSTRTKKQRPLLVARGGHRHWSTRVLYNPFHDQLVLSAGTDALVNLWRISTISSAPLLTLDDEPHPQKKETELEGPNVRVARFEHMDSVNAIAWGAADAWIYMSASYDGKVVVNHVPSKEKYKILL